jgi:hypothetical protein
MDSTWRFYWRVRSYDLSTPCNGFTTPNIEVPRLRELPVTFNSM